MKCKCGKECVLKDNMFNLKRKSFSGWVCECNALYENKKDSMFSSVLCTKDDEVKDEN